MVLLPSIKFALIYISKNTSLRISVPCIIRLNFPHFLFLKPCWILSFLKSTPVILIPLSQNYWQSNLSAMNKKQAWRKVFYFAFFGVLSVSFLSPKPPSLTWNPSQQCLWKHPGKQSMFIQSWYFSFPILISTVYIIIIVVRCCQHPCLVSQIALTAFQANLRIAQDSDEWWWVESCHYNGSSLPMDLYQEPQTCYTGESPWKSGGEEMGKKQLRCRYCVPYTLWLWATQNTDII